MFFACGQVLHAQGSYSGARWHDFVQNGAHEGHYLAPQGLPVPFSVRVQPNMSNMLDSIDGNVLVNHCHRYQEAQGHCGGCTEHLLKHCIHNYHLRTL